MALEDAEIAALKPDCAAGAAIEAKAETIGKNKTGMDNVRCFALAVLAGMFIACGGLFMTFVKADSTLSFAASQLLGGLAFSLGLICVVVAGAELFTGNNLMIMGALSKKYSWGEVAKNWVVVWLGNLVGSLLVIALVVGSNSMGMNGGALGTAMMSIAAGKISLSPVAIVCRGIMCNFLVCLAVWMGFAGRTVIDKIFTCIFPVMAFVAMGFEHCVANMFLLPMGVVACMMGADAGAVNTAVLTFGGCAYNILLATVGNIIGGSVFVGVLYWIGYAKR